MVQKLEKNLAVKTEGVKGLTQKEGFPVLYNTFDNVFRYDTQQKAWQKIFALWHEAAHGKTMHRLFAKPQHPQNVFAIRFYLSPKWNVLPLPEGYHCFQMDEIKTYSKWSRQVTHVASDVPPEDLSYTTWLRLAPELFAKNAYEFNEISIYLIERGLVEIHRAIAESFTNNVGVIDFPVGQQLGVAVRLALPGPPESGAGIEIPMDRTIYQRVLTKTDLLQLIEAHLTRAQAILQLRTKRGTGEIKQNCLRD